MCNIFKLSLNFYAMLIRTMTTCVRLKKLKRVLQICFRTLAKIPNSKSCYTIFSEHNNYNYKL